MHCGKDSQLRCPIAGESFDRSLPFSFLCFSSAGIAGMGAPPYSVSTLLEMEPRTSCTLGKHSTNRATCPALPCQLQADWVLEGMHTAQRRTQESSIISHSAKSKSEWLCPHTAVSCHCWIKTSSLGFSTVRRMHVHLKQLNYKTRSGMRRQPSTPALVSYPDITTLIINTMHINTHHTPYHTLHPHHT